MAKYNQRPPSIEAIQFDGANAAEITEWSGGAIVVSEGGLKIVATNQIVHPGYFVILASGSYLLMDEESLNANYQLAD